ncbi:MAG: TrkH family potassium uptake protein, partial [Actinobacteria bacterium]|nr:TrkH family potassium uptake protein [Actinomycetota bacterium]
MTRAAAARRLGPRTRLAIDVVGALGLVGTLVRYLSLSALAPVAVALGYGESPWPFLGAGAIAGAIGLALERIAARRPRRVGWREGSLVISLTWLLAAAYGGLPYVLAGVPGLDRPIDALFEGMSGFTTTGASLLLDFEALNHSMAMWRQLTQWLGGLGIIVLAFAILPRLHVGGRQLLESELPGPEINQLGDRVRQTVRRFWVLYVALTVLEAIALAVVGWTGLDDRMSPFDAIAHALTTIPTGGFSPESRSLEGFAAATHWVVIVFMFLAGMNFALLWGALLRGRIRALLRDDELQLYAVVLAAAAGLLVVELATEDLSGSDD